MTTSGLLAGAGLGAVLALLFEPRRGGARRARVRDQIVRAGRKTREGLDATARDVANRARGLAATTRGRLSSEDVDDHTLIERVRAQLGHLCSQSRAVDVDAHEGVVTLRGPVPAREADELVSGVQSVRGVQRVIDRLSRYETAEPDSSLQGGSRFGRARSLLGPSRWTPAARALVAGGVLASGVGAAVYTRRGGRSSSM